MINFLFSVFGFALCIFILVFIHELGHYLVARACRVKVLEFAIGFGKTIFTKTKGDTVFALRLIPLGGFVKMYGDNKDEVEPERQHEAFIYKNLWQKSAIVIAGPLFNFILAIALFFVLNLSTQQKLDATIALVKEDSIAQSIGFVEGQKILGVDNRLHEFWGDNRDYIIKQALKKQSIDIAVSNNNSGNPDQVIVIDFNKIDYSPESEDLFTYLGIDAFKLAPVVEVVVPDMPAAIAGLQSGDLIVEIDNNPINIWQDIPQYISPKAGQLLEVLINRDGKLQTIEIIPEKVVRNGLEYGQVGISPKSPTLEFVDIRLNPYQALIQATTRTYDLISLTLVGLGEMVVGNMSIDNISGPVTIADYAGKTAQAGILTYLSFIAFISISLGVINLMPIPVLDGGHLIMFAYEALTGKTLSEASLRIWQGTGMALILMLMSLAFYNDIVRLIQ